MLFLTLLFCVVWGCEMDCGDDDLKTIEIVLQNEEPVCDPGTNQSVRVGDELILNATGSHDPDNYPLNITKTKLGVYWSIWETPYEKGKEPFTLKDPHSEMIRISTEGFLPGSYVFILYVSDAQKIVNCILKIEVV